MIDDSIIKSDLEVASAFETFFANIPVSTTKLLNSSPAEAEALIKQNVEACGAEFKFEYVDNTNVKNTFKMLNIKKTADLWGNSVDVTKSIIDIIVPALASIFNTCIDGGDFPDLMKNSKLIPLYKSGSASDPSNYRPISVLPIFSKVFEKLMLLQLQAFFNKHKILHNSQFGFTKGRSTTDAGVELISYIYEAWDGSRDALGIFCDLSKAFDCVSHEILIGKLHHYGIRNEALKLLISYLRNRTQIVDVNGKRSDGSAVTMGVPQGSILGPFLFLVYINDLPYLVKDHGIVLFADDTSLMFKLQRQQLSNDTVNSAISKVVHWFNVNNLKLNEKKTNCIKFTTPNVRSVGTSVQINDEELELVNTTVFLGITLDAKLQWGPHIEKLSKKLSSAAYAVKKVRLLTDAETARLVYFGYFHSVMSYGILLWGHAADIQTIFVLQKRAIRAIYNLSPRHSLREKFKEINIMTVPSQFIYENLLYTHKNIILFKKSSDVHSYNTRSKDKLVIPRTRLKKVSKTFKCQCVRFYNKVPSDVKSYSINKFKSFIKQKLCRKGYYRVIDYLEDPHPWD